MTFFRSEKLSLDEATLPTVSFGHKLTSKQSDHLLVSRMVFATGPLKTLAGDVFGPVSEAARFGRSGHVGGHHLDRVVPNILAQHVPQVTGCPQTELWT